MNNLKILKSNSFIKFVILGGLITILSNGSLLLMLYLLPLGISTFISRILHAYLGYLANKYGVFKTKGNPIKYILLVIVSWILQWFLIKTLSNLGFSYLFSVLIAIPFLAFFSYVSQKNLVFRK
ncbi:MAG: GtrA family protein [Prochlorococcus marinus CUG1439]|uniref:GtrA family protein n=1 Tax=Prochlorococcus sp. MIT 1314 TaxID=3096220 RepID=UPI001B15BC78|nr:GtrA family protein [Prochlorococcus sp. MIT 1314]MCR8538772.1 GtrA family protein [Prochlorococcus marinus CUG1439]